VSVVVVLVHTWKLWLLTLQRAIVNQATTSIHISQHGRFKVLVVAPGRLHKLLPVPLAATATAAVTSALARCLWMTAKGCIYPWWLISRDDAMVQRGGWRL